MAPSLHEIWLQRLDAAAASRLKHAQWPLPPSHAPAWIESFRDDVGHRRPVDPAFLSHLCGVPLTSKHPMATSDVVLWEQLASGVPDAGVIQPLLDSHAPSLAMSCREMGIEIWTETELASLHALSWLGDGYRPRLHEAAAFVMAELQPDNGTNHPWGIHWFAHVESTTGDRYAGMYAETLLLNAVSNGGVPDLFSALILADAANWLRQHPVRA
jgi:hypothetical protein